VTHGLNVRYELGEPICELAGRGLGLGEMLGVGKRPGGERPGGISTKLEEGIICEL
jgi:hypothetical protein